MSGTTENSAGAAAIRPFTVPITPKAELEALRARIEATRWPDQELVADHSQGPKLAVMQELARYWAAEYDWRRCEAKLTALPHFMTAIDGLDIHFIHVRSQHENALPVIITHGWPGSIIELLAIIDPLTNPSVDLRRQLDQISQLSPGPRRGQQDRIRGVPAVPGHAARASQG